MSSREVESANSGTISPSQDDAFEKFLDEPLSTSSSSSKNGKTTKAAIEKGEIGFDGNRHTWLKRTFGSSTRGQSEKVKTTHPDQVTRQRKSSSDTERDVAVKQVSLEIPYLGSPEKSSDDDEEPSSSFQIDLQKAIDLSLLETPPDDDDDNGNNNNDDNNDNDYTDTFEGEQNEKTISAVTSADSQDDQLLSEIADEPDVTLHSSKTPSLQESIVRDDVKKSDDSTEATHNNQALGNLNIGDEVDAETPANEIVLPDIKSPNDSATRSNSTTFNEEMEQFSLQLDSPPLSEELIPKVEEVTGSRFSGETPTEVPLQLELKENYQVSPKTKRVQPAATSMIHTPTPSHSHITSASHRGKSRISKEPQSARNKPLIVTRGSPTVSKGTGITRNIRGLPSNRGRGGTQSSLTGSEVAHLKRELADQERLLKGFQIENEKLYEEMRVKAKETQEIKTTAAKEQEKFNWQLGNLKEKIRFLEFGKQTATDKGPPDVCQKCNNLLQIQENEELKKELDILQSSVVRLSSQDRSPKSIQVSQDVSMLRQQLSRTELLAADLQLRLTNASASEQNLKSRLECFSRKQTSSQTVAFLEEQLRKLFQIQETRDGNLKELLDEIYQQQNIMKLSYNDAIRQAEEEFQEQRFELECKLRDAENQKGVPIRTHQILSKCIQCDLCTTDNTQLKVEPKSVQPATQSKYVQCNIGNMWKMQAKGQFTKRATKPKSVQCYLGDDMNSHVALENKELKLKMERLMLEHEDSKQYVQNLLRERDKWKSKLSKKTGIYVNQSSTESQLEAAVESQQLLLEHVQRKLETVQRQWELMCKENESLRHQLQQASSIRLEPEEKNPPNQPNAKAVWLLEKNIAELEKRHAQREEQLSELRLRSTLVVPDHLSQELVRCQDQLVHKNSIISHYRQELDTIIAFLRQLLRDQQGMPHHW